MLISVSDTDLDVDTRRVRVASIHDLARLAQRDGGMIFHQESQTGWSRYFVVEGTVIYEYGMSDTAGRVGHTQGNVVDFPVFRKTA
jgi:hypothetical protein